MDITCGSLSFKNEPVWNEKRRYTIWEAAKPSRVPDVDSPLTITTKITWLDIKHPLCWKHDFSFTPLCHINASYLETISNILCRDENWWLCGSQGKIQMFPGYLRPLPESMWQLASCHMDSGNDHIMYDCLLSGEDAS